MDLAGGPPNALSLARLQEQAFAFERAMADLEAALAAGPSLEALPEALGSPLQAVRAAARAALEPGARG